MTYQSWLTKHTKKMDKILEKLSGLGKDEIIDYFDYESLKSKEPNFCPLFTQNKKCHDMKDLNCFFCGCNHFKFDDNGLDILDGKKVFSYCKIKAKNAKMIELPNGYHLDCSGCTMVHTKSYARQ